MPRQHQAPYGNNKLSLKKDINSKRKSIITTNFFKDSARILHDSESFSVKQQNDILKNKESNINFDSRRGSHSGMVKNNPGLTLDSPSK